MLESQTLRDKQPQQQTLSTASSSMGGSGVLVPRLNDAERKSEDASRGWDWRAGFSGKEVSGADIIRLLRFALAEGLSFAALQGK